MIRCFDVQDVPAAARLLAERHARHRVDSPLLAPLEVRAAEAAVASLWESSDGAVAVVGEQVVGYLLGTPRDTASWGASTWVEPAGCAGANVQELWAACAESWVAAGRRAQYALVPPALAQDFFALAFGLQHVHAVRTVRSTPADGRVRQATRGDVPMLAQLDVLLDEHLRASPVFSAVSVAPYAKALAEWEESFDGPDHAVFVVELDGKVVGSAIGCDVSLSAANSGLVAPERAALLGFVAVLPSARGLGLGRALSDAVANWAASSGYDVICTDWRSANLEAAGAWTSAGYEPTFLRLHRLVGH